MVKNKVVIITGAAGGIGSATAHLMGREGAILFLGDIRTEDLDSLEKKLRQEGIKAHSMKLDVTDPESWRAVVEKVLEIYGRIDILVNNAGVVHPAMAEKIPLSKIHHQVSVNFMGNIHGCRSVLPVMKKQNSGKIINVASLGGIVPMPGEAVYSATKAAIRGYSFSLAAELQGTGIHVTTVCPDSVDTAQLRYELLHDEAVLSFIGEPLKPEIVAAAILKAVNKTRPEVLVPPGMGVFARTAMAFPRIFFFVLPLLKRIGSRNISRRRKRSEPERGQVCQSHPVVPGRPGGSNKASNSSRIVRYAAIGEWIMAMGIILFWICFYSFGIVDIPDARLREIYLAFESGFPAADICLAFVLFKGGLGLLRRTFGGDLFSLLGGAGLVFLGLLDISFNAQHGIYRLSLEETLVNGAINLVCLGFGIFLILTVWKNRRGLAAIF